MYQSACRAVVASAMYSDSVVEEETEFCFFESPEIAQPFNMKTYPVTERRVSRQEA